MKGSVAEIATQDGEQAGNRSRPCEFERAIGRGDVTAVRKMVSYGRDVNEPVCQGRMPPLCFAAARNARKVVLAIAEQEECDFLKRDFRGALASENAYLYGQNPALARLLAIKERKQAQEQGINLTRRP